MKKIMTVSALALLLSGNALAGSEYDKCTKQEKALKRQEAVECNGLPYLLNPSACFATQKALKEYTSTGKCKRIGIAENMDFNTPPVIPVEKNVGANQAIARMPDPEAVKNETSCEKLKEENARLKAEISRLKAEHEQPDNACR